MLDPELGTRGDDANTTPAKIGFSAHGSSTYRQETNKLRQNYPMISRQICAQMLLACYSICLCASHCLRDPVFVLFLLCFGMHYFVSSSFAIILFLLFIYIHYYLEEEERELVALLLLSNGCLVTINVLWLLTVPWVGMYCVIVVFPDHTHLLFVYTIATPLIVIISQDK